MKHSKVGFAASTAVFCVTAWGQEGTNEIASALEEIVVTSTRVAEPLSKVPISVAVLTSEQMDAQGVKEFSDIARLTPGLTFNTGSAGSNNIAIRGVASNAGAATTGIYIDDVPIQSRLLSFSSGSLFPEVFDLERVEVLRGPQGTLFGAGSEGGTIRFIQRAPDLTEYSGTARVEGARTQGADESYEAGVAFGGPIIDDVLGFRASVFHRHTGGWIDMVPVEVTVNDPTGASYGDSATFTPTGPARKNANGMDVTSARVAFKAALSDSLSITPSFFYQKQRIADPISTFTLAGSDPDRNRFISPLYTAGPVTAGGFTQLNMPTDEDGSEIKLSSLAVEWNFGAASLYSTSAYADQSKQQVIDGTAFTPDPAPGVKGQYLAHDWQYAFTQEIRLQSSEPDARFRWVTGAFYSRSRQHSFQYNEENSWVNGDTLGYYGAPAVAGGDPFGPGYTAFQNTFGVGPLNDSGTISGRYRMLEQQLAMFGQTDVTFGKLTVTAGVRISRNRLTFSLANGGAEANINAPFGAPCPTGGFCPFGSGPFEPAFAAGTVRDEEDAVTPKIGVSYQATEGLMMYASASKGFRPGGGQLPVSSICSDDQVAYGYVDDQGNPYTPPSYSSDSVWNYEVGQKLRAFNGSLIIDSSAYVIKWDDIQQNVPLPGCGFSITDNLGSATIKGFDLLVRMQPFAGLSLGASLSYTDTKLDDGVVQSNGFVVIPKGSPVVGAGSPFNATVDAEYSFLGIGTFEGYVRADYTYRNQAPRTLRQDPDSFNYDPLLRPDPASSLLNMRVGLRRDTLDASLFVNNLLDSHPVFSLNRNALPAYYWNATTFRPRTIGLTVTYGF